MNFESLLPAPRHAREHGRRGADDRGRGRLQADVRDDHPTGVESPGPDREPDLRAVERHRQVGVDRGTVDLAGRGVDAGGKVDGQDGDAARVDALDQARGLGPGRPVEAGAEQSVDHHVRAREIVGLDRIASRVAQESCGDAPVPAVRSSAADDREAAGVRERAKRLTGHRRRRALHQLVRRVRVAGVPRLGRAHLVGGVERLVHPAATRRRASAGAVRPGRRRTSRRPSCASGSARRRCRASRPARRTAASCP